ncbi:MAG: nuclear transport factor 2 family protein [Candidatus Latescibacterota bacterium]
MSHTALLSLFVLSAAATTPAQAQTREELAVQVQATESAFAATMAARDPEAFVEYLSEEAVFFGRRGVLRGKAEVAAGWLPLFAEPAAPFSWEPEQVEVLDSGTLALSTGPVRGPQGEPLGTFTSVWRRQPDGQWRIVFDKGCPPCDCPDSRPTPPPPGQSP